MNANAPSMTLILSLVKTAKKEESSSLHGLLMLQESEAKCCMQALRIGSRDN